MTRPNVLMIVADDMGYGDIAAFGNPYVRTPNLDRLAGSSTCLRQQYAGSAVCSPSRAALMTGRYPIRTGAITPQEVLGYDRISLREVTLGDAFSSAGYSTGLIGKWHNGALDPRYHPNARGFAEFVGFRGGWADYYKWRLDRNGSFENSDGRYLTDVLTDEGVSFINRHQGDEFFLSVMYNAPHSPLQAPEDVVTKYIDAGLSRGVAITYAMIEIMDMGIGRLLDALDESGLSENTIVMFTADNGPAFILRDDQVPAGVSIDTTRFNCGFNGAKGSVLEGGIRVPMIVRWSGGLDPIENVSETSHFIDWYPTLLSMCSVAAPGGPPLDGRSILTALQGQSLDSEPRFWQWNNYSPVATTNAAMREGDWKLVRPTLDIQFASAGDTELAERYVEKDIEYKYSPEKITQIFDWPEPGRVIPEPPLPQLFNIREDPGELTDMAASNARMASRMLSSLESWFEEVNADRLSHTR